MHVITIDGLECKAREGQTILEVARENKIPIPALCYHDALKPWGACRLCVVELSSPEWKGKTKVVSSCTYPADEGLIVETNSPAVRMVRKTVLNLLLARCPHSKPIQQLAKEYGLTKTTLKADTERDNCILCNICVRVCERLGTSAITSIRRGSLKEVGTPFGDEPPDCIGCLSCARNCPTETIKFEETEEGRVIWGRKFEFINCSVCGKRVMLTNEQVDYFAKKSGLPVEYFKKCDECSRRETAETFAQLVINPDAHVMREWGFNVERIKAMGVAAVGNPDNTEKVKF